MDTSSVVTLKDLVNTILFNTGRDQSDYFHIYNYVISAIREINMLHASDFKVVKLTVNQNTFTIDWPDDYLGLVYLGIPVGGKIHTLTRKDELITTTTWVNGQETLTTEQDEGVRADFGQRSGYGATGGKNIAYYTSDKKNRRFFINGLRLQFAEVILGYKTSGVSDENTLIPVTYLMAIQQWVEWRIAQRADSRNLKEADYFKKEYEQEISLLKAFESPTMDELYDAYYSACIGTYQR